MDLGLRGRVALVTGGSRGIGAATAKLLASEGAHVAISYKSDARAAAAVCAEMQALGVTTLSAPMQLSNEQSITVLIEQIVAQWGRLDVLVNNAVTWKPLSESGATAFDRMRVETWRCLLRENVEGTFVITKSACAVMRERQWGRIVTVSSIAAADGMPGFAWYGAAKAALHGLTRTLAKELGPHGILANVVMAGPTRTDRVERELSGTHLERIARALPVRRLPMPDDVARTIAFLGSAANATITGEIVRASGGRS